LTHLPTRLSRPLDWVARRGSLWAAGRPWISPGAIERWIPQGLAGWRRLRLLCLPLALLPLAQLCQLCRLQLRGLLRTVRLQACVQRKLSGRVCIR
jgi:hypothetical protein